MRLFALVVALVVGSVGCTTVVEGKAPTRHACADTFAGTLHATDADRVPLSSIYGEDDTTPLCDGFPKTMSFDFDTNESLTSLVLSASTGSPSTLTLDPNDTEALGACSKLRGTASEPSDDKSVSTSIYFLGSAKNITAMVGSRVFEHEGDATPICGVGYISQTLSR